MLKELIKNTTPGVKLLLLVVWLLPVSLSFLFPKWTYYEICEVQGEKRLYKQEAPRQYRFDPPPLYIDRSTPGWHGLEEPMQFDVVEPENGWMLVEWGIISLVWCFLFRETLKS